MTNTLPTLRDVADVLGITYRKLYYAHWTRQLPEPRKCGRVRLYTVKDVDRIRAYFAARGEELRPSVI
jgi:DNA-binding transcriptional MerR regulator